MATWQEMVKNAGGDPTKLGKNEAAAFKGMYQELQRLRQRQDLTMGSGDSSLGTNVDMLNIFQNRFEELQKTISNFAGQGYGLGDDSSEFSTAMSRAIEMSDTFLGNMKAGPEAMAALSQGFEGGQFEAFVEQLGESAGLLATNAASLKRLGLDMRTFAKNVDIMTFSFNASEVAIKSINQNLFDFAKEVKMLPSVVSRNFQTVATQLAYPVGKINEEFKKIQEMSAKTGVSVNKLMGSFGQQTDTISGASSFAAGLNTILGKNVFSATQVLMMSEADRMEKTREVLKESQIYKDYMSDDPRLKKFALRAISGKIGMSLDETRRFLDGGDGKGTVKDRMADETSENFKNAGSKLEREVENLAKAIEKNVNIINQTQRFGVERDLAFDRTAKLESLMRGTGELGAETRAKAVSGLAQRFGQLAAGGGTGTAKIFETAVDELSKKPEKRGVLNRVINDLQRTFELAEGEPRLDGEFRALINGRGDTPGLQALIRKNPDQALKAMADFRAAGKNLTEVLKREGDTRLETEEATALKRLSEGKTRIERARLLRAFREGQGSLEDPDGNEINVDDITGARIDPTSGKVTFTRSTEKDKKTVTTDLTQSAAPAADNAPVFFVLQLDGQNLVTGPAALKILPKVGEAVSKELTK